MPLDPPRRAIAVLLVVLVWPSAACGPQAPADPGSGGGSDLGLPPCGTPPSEDPTPPPGGAVLPPMTRLTAVREEPPRIQLNAYVEATPAGVREWIESHPDLDVVSSAHTPTQTELLVTHGTWRTYVKARAVCAGASLLSEVIAPVDSDAVLPTPALATPAP